MKPLFDRRKLLVAAGVALVPMGSFGEKYSGLGAA